MSEVFRMADSLTAKYVKACVRKQFQAVRESDKSKIDNSLKPSSTIHDRVSLTTSAKSKQL